MSACLFFKMECEEAREDERVMVIGNRPELGLWDAVGGVVLEPDLASGGRPFWVSGRVDLDLHGWTDLQFRFVIARMDAPIITGWEQGPGNGLREIRICEGQCFEVSGSWEKAGWMDCRLMHSFFMDSDRQAVPEESEELGGQKQQSQMESITVSMSQQEKGVGEDEKLGSHSQSSDHLITPPVYLQSGVSPTDVPPPPPSTIPPFASPKQTHANLADTGTKPLIPLGLAAFAQTEVPTHLSIQKNPSTHERAMQHEGGSETARQSAEVSSSFPALLSLKRPRDPDSCLHPDSDSLPHAIERLSGKRRDGVSVPISRERKDQKGECTKSAGDELNAPPLKRSRLSGSFTESVDETALLPSRKSSQIQKAAGRQRPHSTQRFSCNAEGSKGTCMSSAKKGGVLRDKWGHRLCEHLRVHNKCKECGGASICEHVQGVRGCKHLRARAGA
uniref:CBM20 domain-containing protein n=1 Tax=Chromera velia CCMP2878 TaxID=1169474 RepID=A0A0G4HC84_9ALVE|eukprot:Cvel_6229.t1-p1 / transcript=Cvel_6229.t1 / gene=Cvel_6229 / organism=Chromera_velia_CCMP2878 / gene_product=hypothetical protein / transcript_product=hypothetical protein / location=Cvel_scaffold301:58802-60139(-) / protein_length=446 / sequence_SO=supercontig / SO=protein_coding / is_pseudo=false